MNFKQDVIDFAVSLPGAVCDMPFPDDFDTTVLRHADSGKWFGIIMSVPARRLGAGDGFITVLNLKCDPDDGFILREIYSAVIPAYHMNKTHWISVLPDRDLPADKLNELITGSYELTKTRKHIHNEKNN